MKILKSIFILLTLVLLSSCGGGASDQAADAEGFDAIETEVKDKFGDDAYYTDFTVLYDSSIGNSVVVTVTEDPASLKMGEWTLSRGTWTQSSEITLEIPEGSQAKDFMFQLGETINLKKLGGLIEESVQRLKDEKSIDNPTLNIASIQYPDNGDISKAKYTIDLKPENGGTSFNFYYKLSGEFIEMDY